MACAREGCSCEVGAQQYEHEGRVYCCEKCALVCKDGACECTAGDCDGCAG